MKLNTIYFFLYKFNTNWNANKLILNLQKDPQKTGTSSVVETLYRNKTSLEAIFRIIDKDNSGLILLFF